MDQTNKINNILSSVKNFADEKYSTENGFKPGETFIPASGKVIDTKKLLQWLRHP